MLDLDALEQSAAKANQAWWAGVTPREGPAEIGRWQGPFRISSLPDEDAAFVAACDPWTLLQLVRVARAALLVDADVWLAAIGDNDEAYRKRQEAADAFYAALVPFRAPR